MRAEQTDFPAADHFSYMLDVLNNGSTADDKVRLINTRYDDQERYLNSMCFTS